MAESPLSRTPRVLGTLLVLLLAAGCASRGGVRHVASVSVVSVHAVLSAVQDTERALVCGTPAAPAAPACVSADLHQRISADLVTAFEYDGQALRIVRELPAGSMLPATVPELLGKIAALIDRIVATIPASTQKQSLVAQLGGVK